MDIEMAFTDVHTDMVLDMLDCGPTRRGIPTSIASHPELTFDE